MSSTIKESLSDKINRELTLSEQLKLTITLSTPSIMAQLSTICMQYIDAAMVGSLGANASASVGILMAPMWLFSGICISSISGFSVQVAHLLGAKDEIKARKVVRQGYVFLMLFASIIAMIGMLISPYLPILLGGNANIVDDASKYFFIFAFGLPFMQLSFISAAMLRCSGNMLLPSLISILMCILDVIFNYLLIFPSREIDTHLDFIGTIHIYGANLGVQGAALGTFLAGLITGIMMCYFLIIKSPTLALFKNEDKVNFGGQGIGLSAYKLSFDIVRRALRISLPVSLQQAMISSAQIVSTLIVAPLGTISIAAHAFAITIEALCYMPGFGIADAATTLIGQSIGARKQELTYRFAKITLIFGTLIMSITGALMFIFAPYIMNMMTPNQEVQALAVSVLRIEAFAEPLFAVAIIGYGICVGAGSSLIPSLINLLSMWVVRLILAYFLAQIYGLKGVWLAMCIELSFRGICMLLYIRFGKWIKTTL